MRVTHSSRRAEVFDLGLIEYATMIRGYVRRRFPRDRYADITPDDLFQDIWVSAQASLPRGLDRQAAACWLVTVANRKIGSVLRKASANGRCRGTLHVWGRHAASSCLDVMAAIADGQRTPSSEDAAREGTAAVREALGDLPEDQLRAVCLHHFEGCSRREIADMMGITPTAVHGLLYRGLKSLRRRLGDVSRFFSDDGESEIEEDASSPRSG